LHPSAHIRVDQGIVVSGGSDVVVVGTVVVVVDVVVDSVGWVVVDGSCRWRPRRKVSIPAVRP